MSEAYGKAMVADVVLSLSRKPLEKSEGIGRLFVAKNRAGKDGILFPVGVDTERSKFEILDSKELTIDEIVNADTNTMKNLLRDKWRELTDE
jgi:hypothetical protein